MNKNARKRNESGFTLIEVLIGIVIFAVGMMALAQLQGSLARNSGDSNARTVAINLAEETIESLRTFRQIPRDGVNSAYEDIRDLTIEGYERGNVLYDIVIDATDYYYVSASQPFTTTAPVGAAHSDMKLVAVTVTWNDSQEFQVDEGNTTAGRLGSGSITLRDVISSITSPSGGKVVLGNAGDNSFGPPVDYNPGENPDIISIELGHNKFKESTTPLPDVIRQDELVETRFDVVTYSQNDAGATFLRREEFRALSCECTLRIPASDAEGGLRPTTWNGIDYTEGEFVSKPYGAEASNQQSAFCGMCCRDHHDGGTGVNDEANDPGKSLYNPFRYDVSYYGSEYGALQGNHKHYRRDRQGNLTLATADGDLYMEACRMVRKDGFWRIAQDLRQEGLNAFPGDYLDQESEIDVYSNYVTDAVKAYELATDPSNNEYPSYAYESNPPVFKRPENMPTPVIFPATTTGNATQMASGGVIEQQLRSRGIYVDYMSDLLRQRINCLDRENTPESCGVPEVTTALEIIPFYDVQLTWLARWNETPNNNPVDVSNQAIADNNSHSRGVATLMDGFGYSTVNSAIHTRNLGLTGTDPIDPWYGAQVRDRNLYVLAVDYDNPPPLSGVIVAGSITSAVGGVKAADVEIEATDAQCDRTLTGYECVIQANAQNPRIRFYNYFKSGKVLYGCSTYLQLHGTEHSGDIPSQNWTRFNLPKTASTSVANVVIKENSCT